MSAKKCNRRHEDLMRAPRMVDDLQTAFVRAAEEGFELIKQLGPEHPYYKELLAKLLARVNPKEPLGTPLFNAVARLSWSLAFEAVVLRWNPETGELEVYLRRRSPDDAYANQWHSPGSVRRSGESWRQVADRLAKEFGAPIYSFQEIGWADCGVGAEERGSFMSFVFMVQLEGEPRLDERHGWFPVSKLPKTVWSHRRIIIPMAVINLAAKNHLPFGVGVRFAAPKKKAAKQAANPK